LETSGRWRYSKRGRGRPSRRTILYFKVIESIIGIAGRYNLDPKHLIDAYVEAWSYKTSYLGNLKITCREVKQDSATLLITDGEKVVSQFPINLDVLRNPEYLKAQIQHFPQPYHAKKKLKKIDELRDGMRRIDVKARIIEVPPALHVHTRFGTMADVSNVKIGDETGSIRLSLWNEQIDKVHVGENIELKNCHISRYKGESQIRLGRKGTLSIIDDEDASIAPSETT
jgi:replication factor A1